MPGKLILFPVPIGAEDYDVSLPQINKSLINTCHTFIVEELRTARRFLKAAGYTSAIDDTTFFLLNEHTTEQETAHYLDALDRGENVGLLSEAGLPCVADPGVMVTRQAQRRGYEIVPLVGPSSLMLALMASGLDGQHFAFNGYLPVDKRERTAAIRSIEMRALKEGQTQIFIEAPYRNNQMLEALCDTCHDDTCICVATDITMPTQMVRTLTVRQWRIERSKVNLHKRNTVFLLGGLEPRNRK
ncbi:MAG: SAM-dependent methyltransferase [Bacteroidales bacterium]|nr:SAM-dependent methyltransferase [Bacteroidales bacterium]